MGWCLLLTQSDLVLLIFDCVHTGLCMRQACLYRLKATETDQCIRQNGLQSPEHILQLFFLFGDLRAQTWPREMTVKEKL